jgi:hypothetical protein
VGARDAHPAEGILRAKIHHDCGDPVKYEGCAIRRRAYAGADTAIPLIPSGRGAWRSHGAA